MVKFTPKCVKNQRTGHISEVISPKTQLGAFNYPSADDFDLWSRSKVKVKFSQKWVKKQRIGQGQRSRIGHISEAISPTDCILGTKVQPNKLHSVIQVSMTLTLGQGQRSRSKVKFKIFTKWVKY